MKRLNTALLPTLAVNRVRLLDTKAGSTPRTRGRAWQAKRREVMLRDQYTCASCGAVGHHEVDHKIPLERGGSGMNDDNLQLLCSTCHKTKTADEARARSSWGGGGVKSLVD